MKKSICLYLLVFVLFLSFSVAAQKQQIIGIDSGTFSGFFGFSYEYISGLSGYKVGMGITDPESIRLGLAYKYYFPDPTEEDELLRSRVSLGPEFSLSLNQILTDLRAKVRAGLSLGYDINWGSHRQYLLHFRGGIAVNFPAEVGWFYYDLFSPTFGVTFGYTY